jgi:hypothetical protein
MIDRHAQLLLDCRLSGQVSDAQWDEHLKDPEFAKFAASEMGVARQPKPTLGARERAFDAFYSDFQPTDCESALDLAEVVFKAGWNARKQIDYEAGFGIKR